MQTPITFVTGATGLVGAYLLRYLVRDGVTVRALKRPNSPMNLVENIADKVEWIEGDILDVSTLETAMSGVDCVYHSAAMISFDSRDRERMFDINIQGTANVVNLALSLKINRLLHVSSIAALGREEDAEDTEYIDESAKWTESKLNSNYAISKFRAECEVWRGMAEGLNVVVVNPSMILGSGYWKKGSAAIFERLSRGMKYYPAGGTGYVDVRDVAQAMIALMNSPIEGKRFILNSENMSWRDFMTLSATWLKTSPPTKAISAWSMGILCRLEWLRSRLTQSTPLLTRESIRNTTHTSHYDNSNIKNAIGFEFRPVETSVRETAEQFLATYPKGIYHAYLPL